MVLTLATIAMLGAIFTFIWLIYSKDAINSRFLTFLTIAVAFYLIGNYIEIVNFSMEGAQVGLSLRFMGIPFIPTLWYLCVREFCGLKFKKPYTVFLLLIVPVIIVILAQTWHLNHLFFNDVHYLNGNNNGNLKIVPGPLFVYRNIYQYGIELLGIITIISCYIKGTKHFKSQAALFLISVLIPLFNVTTYIIKVGDYNVDITPYGLIVATILFIITLYKFGVLNQSTIVRENAMNHLYEGVLIFDNKGIFMDANNSARNILPQINTAKMGTCVDDMDYLPFTSASLIQEEGIDNHTCEFTREYGDIVKTFSVSISKIYLKQKLIGYSTIINNISPIKKLLTELEVKSSTDALTGLFNRGYLFTMGESIVQNIKLSYEPFSVVIFDLDFFKRVNDTYGHIYGDYVLKTIAMIASSDLRATDIVGRYGGEEFCIILSNTPYDGAVRKAETVRQKIAGYLFEKDGIKINLTASFGVACFEHRLANETFVDIIHRADDNLYKAKDSGRNKVC